MKFKISLLSFVFLAILFSNCATQEKNIELPKELVESIEKRIDFGLNGAIAIGLIDSSGTYYYNFGTRNLNGDKVTEHSIFEIGSITKTFTAALLANEYLKGNLKIDDLVSDMLPDSIKTSVFGNKRITLGHLSDHISGLPGWPSNMKPANQNNPFADYSELQLYEFITSFSPKSEVGETFEYSNLGVGLLGHILSLHAEKSYEALMIQTICNPLEMSETKTIMDNVMNENLAIGKDEFGRYTNNWDFMTLEGAGAIKSSTADMIKYISAQLGIIKTDLNESFELCQQKRHSIYPVKEGELPSSMGLGWIISPMPKGDVFWHTGGTGGYRTYAAFNKQTGKGVVVLASGSDPSDIGRNLISSIPLNDVKRSLSADLAQKIDSKGIKYAEAYFEDTVKNNLDNFIYGSYPLNRLGHGYLNEDNFEAALAVFEINIQLFPESWNVYESYADALRRVNRLKESLANYQKSLELNPQNNNVLKAISEIENELFKE
jgi:CubicO group peptidase (beta-lactamase class C family)